VDIAETLSDHSLAALRLVGQQAMAPVLDISKANFYTFEDLEEEYTLTQGKLEFAEDVWRAVTWFLSSGLVVG
jgi:hypothetical protein